MTSGSDVPHVVQWFALLLYNAKVLVLNPKRDKDFFFSCSFVKATGSYNKEAEETHAFLELQITYPWNKLYYTARWILGG